jgi:proteasome lid subunit RPN8/RPN11
VRRSVLNDVHAHAHSSLNAEICGVLVGDVVRDEHGPFVYIEASIRGEFASSQFAGVTFTAETWTYMQGILDKQHPGKRIVGWYHSHPDFGIFLSEMDLFIHRHFFNLAWQVALVYDPIRSEEGMFIWRGGTPTRESFVVEEDTKIVEHEARAASTSEDAGPSPNRKPANQELLALRSKVRWLSAGVILALVVSVVWPVVLIVASQRTPWARDIIRSLRWPGTSIKTAPEESEEPPIPHSEHGETLLHEVPQPPLRLQDKSGPLTPQGSRSGEPSPTLPASPGPRSNE